MFAFSPFPDYTKRFVKSVTARIWLNHLKSATATFRSDQCSLQVSLAPTIKVLDWIIRKNLSQMPWCNIFVLTVAETKPLTFAKAWISDVARNFRLPNRGGEIDLIGWDRDVLCFIEVKTRTTRNVKPAEAGRWIAKSFANC